MIVPKHKIERLEGACDEHLDMVIDDYINDYEESPDIYSVDDEDLEQELKVKKCKYCNEKAKYSIL